MRKGIRVPEVAIKKVLFTSSPGRKNQSDERDQRGNQKTSRQKRERTPTKKRGKKFTIRSPSFIPPIEPKG